MAQCSVCNAETELRVNRVPICVKCEDARSKKIDDSHARARRPCRGARSGYSSRPGFFIGMEGPSEDGPLFRNNQGGKDSYSEG
jgi:hypothetical protein